MGYNTWLISVVDTLLQKVLNSYDLECLFAVIMSCLRCLVITRCMIISVFILTKYAILFDLKHIVIKYDKNGKSKTTIMQLFHVKK